MFASLSAQSPALAYFPASQRVTYLYYLGRYLFSNNLFFPAQTALQAAYDQCHRQAFKQKQLILTYLIPCNMIMGRFPSRELLQRPESQALAQWFVPICQLIVRGDYIAFRKHLAVDSPHTQWFAQKGLLLPLRNRCEILVWRSLTRKVFIHGGFHGDTQAEGQRGPPPFLYLNKLETAVKWLQSQHAQTATASGVPKDSRAKDSRLGSQVVYKPPDDDFDGIADLEHTGEGTAETVLFSRYGDYLAPDGSFDVQGLWRENHSHALVDGEPDTDYSPFELDPYTQRVASIGDEESEDQHTPAMREIESILSSLLTQSFMRGYLTHKNPRFAIPGARQRGALPTGFPNVWQTIYGRESEETGVPGWVQMPSPTSGVARAGGGRVVNLSGARPVGVQ